ncbi:MAG: thiamine diphosphokinase [Bacteroidota bacterium]|nr:thiamine diphosphokinase [Bacteroidota bacterium]
MQTIIFLNGTPPGKNIIKKFLKEKCFIIAADGGANYLKKVNVTPDLIIGDLDSINKHTLQYFQKRKVKVSKIKEQDTNDFEKSLMYCKKNKFEDIIVFGAAGLRPDHTLNNYSVLKRYYKSFNIRLISGEFEILFIKKFIKFRYRVNEIVSLLALPKAAKIHTKGLKYRLSNESLSFGVREGTLNKSISEDISISFESGSLLLFKKHFIK